MYDARATVPYYMKTPESGQRDPIAAMLLAQVQQLRQETYRHLIGTGLAGPDSRSLRTLFMFDPELGTVQETSSCTPIPFSLESTDCVPQDGIAFLYQDIHCRCAFRFRIAEMCLRFILTMRLCSPSRL